MGDIIPLRSPIDITSDLGRAFITDATRAGEGVISDQELQERYELSAADLASIAKDKKVGRAIRDEGARRVRTGLAARELAAKHFVKMPGILAGIAENVGSNPRHVIEAAREIRAVAHGGSDGDGPSSQNEKFSIIINLGADAGDRIEKVYDRPKKPVQLEMDLENKDDGNGWG